MLFRPLAAAVVFTGLLVAGASAQGPASTAEAPRYLPHRAIYEVTLAPGRERGTRTRIESARGRLVYEFAGSACEGYTTNLRFVTEINFGEGQSHVSDIRSNTFESGNAQDFRFVTQSIVNGQTREQADGSASRDPNAIRVELRRPQRSTAEMPAAALFPTQHLTQALEAARRGEIAFEADIYDGAEGGKKLYGTTAILRRPITTELTGHPTDVPALRGQRRFPMTISFFDKAATGGGEQIPLYELSIEVFETGVTHSLMIDYGEFALRGTMVSLEMLPVTPCN